MYSAADAERGISKENISADKNFIMEYS